MIPEDDLSDVSTKKDEWPLVSHVEEVVLQDTEMCSVSEAVIIAEPTPDEVCITYCRLAVPSNAFFPHVSSTCFCPTH